MNSDDTTLKLASYCMNVLEGAKAHEITNICLNGNSSIADTMILSTGTSTRHVLAIARRLEDELYKYGVSTVRLCGMETGEWVIVDTGSVMIHILDADARSRYELDSLYKCMQQGPLSA